MIAPLSEGGNERMRVGGVILEGEFSHETEVNTQESETGFWQQKIVYLI